MFTVHDWDRAQLLYADPQHFIDAVKILSALIEQLSAFPVGGSVMLYAHISPGLVDAMSEWGDELTDFETDADLEEEPDLEEDYRNAPVLEDVIP